MFDLTNLMKLSIKVPLLISLLREAPAKSKCDTVLTQ